MTNANWRRDRKTGSSSMARLLLGGSVRSDHPCSVIPIVGAAFRARITSAATSNATTATMLWHFMFPSRFQDIALQTLARVPEHGVDERSCNRAGHAEREARLDRHAVGESS